MRKSRRPDDAHLERLTAELDLLVACGLLDGYEVDPATDAGVVTLSAAASRLTRVGRMPQAEPTFLQLLARGGPAAVREWVEREAAALDDA